MKKISILALIFLVSCVGFWFYTKGSKVKPDPNISSFRNSNLGISFKYPTILTAKTTGQSINIHHEIPFEHHDYCDFKGEATTTIKTLTDFNVEIHTASKNLVETMKSESPYIPDENFINGDIVPSPGFIDPVKFGALAGFSIFEGAEGCGHTIYYLEISDSKTLVITNDFITALSGVIDASKVNEILAVPGVISKESSEGIFRSILNSLIIK